MLCLNRKTVPIAKESVVQHLFSFFFKKKKKKKRYRTFIAAANCNNVALTNHVQRDNKDYKNFCKFSTGINARQQNSNTPDSKFPLPPLRSEKPENKTDSDGDIPVRYCSSTW